MKRVLLVDINGQTKELDTELLAFAAFYGTPEEAREDPYQVARHLLGCYAEKVHPVGRPDFIADSIVMMVDDTGAMTNEIPNGAASYRWYPGPIHGNVVLMRVHQVGPDLSIVDHEWDGITL